VDGRNGVATPPKGCVASGSAQSDVRVRARSGCDVAAAAEPRYRSVGLTTSCRWPAADPGATGRPPGEGARWWGTTGAAVASPLRNSCPPRSSRWSSSRTRTTIRRASCAAPGSRGWSQPATPFRSSAGRTAPAGAGHVLVRPGPSRRVGCSDDPADTGLSLDSVPVRRCAT